MDLRETPAEQQLRQLQAVLDQGKQAQEEKRLDDAVRVYQSIIAEKLLDTSSDDLSKIKEEAIYRLGNIYAEQQKPEALAQLNRDIRPFFKDLPKAKTAKIVRTIIELVGKIPNTLQTQIDVCKESIEWCNREKRNFLRQRIETRLSELYFEKKEFQNALSLIEKLVKEVRRLDDKALLVEILLLESHVHHSLRNLGKSKASLTGARSAANAIYCPPLLQAEIDMQSGILHAEEKDYKTGYSYFFEAFEGFNNMDSRAQATKCLKYMILCKIMNNQTEDVQVLLSSKSALKFGGDDVEAMRGIANAYSARSLHQFEDVIRQYEPQLKGDLTINTHLQELYDSLLESHLARIIEPFSRVEISHVAKLINLPRDRIERKLSQMILDERLNGILDQGQDCIVLFDEKKQDELYPAALQTIDNLNTVVDSLFDRIRQELAAK